MSINRHECKLAIVDYINKDKNLINELFGEDDLPPEYRQEALVLDNWKTNWEIDPSYYKEEDDYAKYNEAWSFECLGELLYGQIRAYVKVNDIGKIVNVSVVGE
jgi:hypothetical protein